MIRIMTLILGISTVLIGALWLLQGLGIVKLQPLLSFADCLPVQGSSTAWAVIGALAIAVGAVGVVWSRKKTST